MACHAVHVSAASQSQCPWLQVQSAALAMAETVDSAHQVQPLQDGYFSQLPVDAQHAMLKCISPGSLGALLATNKHFHQLVKGFISSIKIQHCKDIVGLSSWPHLRRLDLSSCQVGAKHITKLARGRLLSLQHLDLSNNPLCSEAAEQLVSASLPSLTSLKLSNAIPDCTPADEDPIEDSSEEDEVTAAAECQAFCRHLAAGSWPNLAALDLSDNTLSLKAWSLLVRWSSWPAMQTLDVRGCLVDDVKAGRNGLLPWLISPRWPRLTQL